MQSIEKHIIKYSSITIIGLIIFFYAMKALNLIQVVELRALNSLIMFSGAYLAIKGFRDKHFKYSFNYLSGLAVGFFISITVAIGFSVFVCAYMFLDPAFLAQVKAEQPQGQYLNEFAIAMVIFIEAMASGFLFSYSSMQL
ncbi:MAG: hypothetical protein AAF789_08735, partial [Bacteroidota bacterium]